MVSFDLVFKAFLNRITDYGLAELKDEEVKITLETMKEIFHSDVLVTYSKAPLPKRTIKKVKKVKKHFFSNIIYIINKLSFI